MSELTPKKYPLLGEILAIKGLSLQATYKNKDAASIFGCSVRAIQERVASGNLVARDLPGKARFLSVDLEQFLENSKKGGK
jgi:hypothetical protein